MHSTKSKDRPKLSHDHKFITNTNNKYFYDINQYPQSNPYSKKDKKPTKNLNHYNHYAPQQQQNQAIFKNIEKCNEKMEYYKLMGSLEQQKRTMLQQQNDLLRQQNQQLKRDINLCQKQVKRLSNHLDKFSNQLEKYHASNQSKQDDFFIELPKKRSKEQSRSKKTGPRNDQNQEEHNCEKCAYLQEKLMQERVLYQKDRTYLKQQISNLNQTVDDSQKQQKLLKKELQGKDFSNEKKEFQNEQKFMSIQNKLKQQLTYCYQAFQEKCKTISQLQKKIDLFQQQNHRIIKLLTLFDDPNPDSHHLAKKYQIYPLQRPGRIQSTFHLKDKNSSNPCFLNLNHKQLKEANTNIIDNRIRNRKCGSIKKIEVD